MAELTRENMERVDIAGQIESQFPSKLPPDDYQFEFSFRVLLDFRDWKIVIRALEQANACAVHGDWHSCDSRECYDKARCKINAAGQGHSAASGPRQGDTDAPALGGVPSNAELDALVERLGEQAAVDEVEGEPEDIKWAATQRKAASAIKCAYGSGSPLARLGLILDKLDALFPNTADRFGAVPPEFKYLDAIVALWHRAEAAERDAARLNDCIDQLEVYGTPDHPMGVTIAVHGCTRHESARAAIDAYLSAKPEAK